MKAELEHPYNIFFGTLANQTRLEIIMLLANRPLNVTQICKKLRMKQPTISKRLTRLERCGFLFREHKGKECIYTLNQTTIKPLTSLMKAHVRNYCSKVGHHNC